MFKIHFLEVRYNHLKITGNIFSYSLFLYIQISVGIKLLTFIIEFPEMMWGPLYSIQQRVFSEITIEIYKRLGMFQLRSHCLMPEMLWIIPQILEGGTLLTNVRILIYSGIARSKPIRKKALWALNMGITCLCFRIISQITFRWIGKNFNLIKCPQEVRKKWSFSIQCRKVRRAKSTIMKANSWLIIVVKHHPYFKSMQDNHLMLCKIRILTKLHPSKPDLFSQTLIRVKGTWGNEILIVLQLTSIMLVRTRVLYQKEKLSTIWLSQNLEKSQKLGMKKGAYLVWFCYYLVVKKSIWVMLYNRILTKKLYYNRFWNENSILR